MNNKKIVAGILAGIAAGAVISLLFSRKGKKLRKTVHDEGISLSKNLREKFNEFIDRMDEKIQSV
ncbi:MAG TPA: YtxH domain-containing protein [Puia sp.]|nr:YtxH domain-containing protein [Puia sp.]